MRGLSEAEALRRLEVDGFNELPSTKNRSLFAIAWDVAREPMFLLLLSCGAVYLLSGEIHEALMLLGFVFVVMGITLHQERKTERALEALRDLSSPRALVLRDGEKKRIPGREVVVGDLLLLAEGDRVPADAFLLETPNLSVDESLLTGESVPVRKAVGSAETAPSRPGGDDLPFVFSGTLVVQGQGLARVLATGAKTEMGKIGKALQVVKEEDTPLQRQTAGLVRAFAIVGASLCVTVVLVYGFTRGHWLPGFLAGLSLAMAMLPEEFPVVLTIFLALGAWRMSQHRVLTRRVPAIETLGSATVLCVDKTGTLTMNRMTVSDLCAGGAFHEIDSGKGGLPEAFHEILEFSLLASPADPFDPMEKAMKELGERSLAGTEHLHGDWEFLKEYPLSRKLLAMSRVWRSPGHEDFVIASKGAPEAIADLCHFTPEQNASLERNIDTLSGRGRRVIAVAAAHFNAGSLPAEQHDYPFRFVGLLGLQDPVRPGVAEAIKECYGAGIRTLMVTGDYPGTARHIAQEVGLKNPDEVITGPQFESLSDEELAARVRTVNVFARMVPEQKLRLVQALKRNGEVTAMTGDGVNDAPALKAAHIGIAMGGRGTDVAREAASIVLLDDDFGSIVKAVRMGRRIYDNLRRAMLYIFSVHIPIAGLSLVPVLLKWPLALLPVHIVFLELIIDPACSVVFEAEKAERDAMDRPPRKLSEPIFGRKAVILGSMQGTMILAISIAVYAWAMKDHGENAARALAFTTLVLGNLSLILTNRSSTRSILRTLSAPNAALWWVLGGTSIALVCSMTVPFLKSLFRFSSVPPADLGICTASVLLALVIMESLKWPHVKRFLSLTE